MGRTEEQTARIRRWVEALRSGEYRQGKKYLRLVDGDGGLAYCCLGVLCDLAKKEGFPGFRFDDGYARCGDEYDDQLPPLRFMSRYVGIDTRNPWVSSPEGSQHSLAELNDFCAYDFTGIATLIELEFLPLTAAEVRVDGERNG